MHQQIEAYLNRIRWSWNVASDFFSLEIHRATSNHAAKQPNGNGNGTKATRQPLSLQLVKFVGHSINSNYRLPVCISFIIKLPFNSEFSFALFGFSSSRVYIAPSGTAASGSRVFTDFVFVFGCYRRYGENAKPTIIILSRNEDPQFQFRRLICRLGGKYGGFTAVFFLHLTFNRPLNHFRSQMSHITTD